MYIRVRKFGAKQGEHDITITISKKALIQTLRSSIKEKLKIPCEHQVLIYKGKQLIDDHRVLDYNIQLNDIVQLIVRSTKPQNEQGNSIKNYNRIDENKSLSFQEVQSKYYKIGDLIDVRLPENGAWYEAIITKIFTKSNNLVNDDTKDILFTVKSDKHVLTFEIDVSFNDMRPRSYYIYKISELKKDMVVLVNYNIEEAKLRGPWFDFKVDMCSGSIVKGTILMGTLTTIDNCNIKFIEEIMRIEKPILLSQRNIDNFPNDPPHRKYPYNCKTCKDAINRKCKECGCRVCAGKESCDTMILCDECDYGYHIACLNPPLASVPTDDEWYCPECKTDDTEIVKAGEKLKLSKKKVKMASSKNESKRDWGKGMACVGRMKECTIVPKDHYGPVPGIEVGTCWKFRIQVSEAGIHRPHVAGIHGRESDGAYSIVLSGGYEDDIDNGNEFYYTGSGGRDLSGNKRCSEQSSDQKLTRMNKALALNCNVAFNDTVGAESKDWKKGKPVRVVRNYKGSKHSKYSPQDGNRYDGIYKVVKYYPEKGKAGFNVWRYLLRRDDPTPAPWEKGGKELDVIYPQGYLEALKVDTKENNDELDTKTKHNSKRKNVEKTKSLTDFFTNSVKKRKIEEYTIPDDVTEFIKKDTANEKLWSECKNVLKDGKGIFLTKIEEIFMCICCQELVYEPITTECKHNICKSCLKRSFSAEIYSCPNCRQELGKNFSLHVNDNLGKSLQILFPGYGAARN